jgi:dephospho-CoA kinase
MRFIAVTGGIGMGKSTVAEYLARRGELLVDSDLLARELVEPGQPALTEITNVFGPAMLNQQGALDRRVLADRVFNDANARRQLEAILHPRIRAAWKEKSAQWRTAGAARGFAIIPLLYETGGEAEVDTVICVGCSREIQRARLLGRNWSDDEIDRRIAAQAPITQKLDRANFVIWNESTVAVCEEQCARILSRIA